ncbi:MAG: DUF1566 domain-containing protein [Thiohalomonadales bacterium]
METSAYLQTGQVTCHETSGLEINCPGTGQDGEFSRGVSWPKPRFEIKQGIVIDQLTGLIWCGNANLAEFPLMWQEALDYVIQMNRDRYLDFNDWRVPNRHELRSLINHQTKRPALPEDQPFKNIFNGWYWSSTTAAISPAHAWYVSIDGGRMFFGGKDQSYMLWPVRGHGNNIIPVTGQQQCYDEKGAVIPCTGTGQDAELCYGHHWPTPRFDVTQEVVTDRLTRLCWFRIADLNGAIEWEEALTAINRLNNKTDNTSNWRLPNINELESLVDCANHSPALPTGHPFISLQDVYWSSTTSLYEPDWAWALYLDKGAVGVGQKSHAKFHVWVVYD